MMKWLTNLFVKGYVQATEFITTGGTSSDFVKGDGSLDSNSYATETYVDTEIDNIEVGELKKIGDGYGLQHQVDNPTFYGTLGYNAINLSKSDSVGNYGATGDYSHAEGLETTASGTSSHAEGDGTIASNFTSHAEGAGTTASGGSSHAEGSNTIASGNHSHAEGHTTIAGSLAENSRGIYNEIIAPISATSFDPNDVIESVGVGANNSTRKNALTRWKNGAFKWLLQPLSNITNAVIGFHAADEEGRLNYHDGTEWKKYVLFNEIPEGVDISGKLDKGSYIGTASDLDDAKEDKFTKNTAFNKDFGVGENDVARGNHTHTFASLTSKPTTISGYGITDFNSLGDARWALRSRTITGTGSLTGGGNLTANRTLDLTTTAKSDITKGVTAHGWGDWATGVDKTFVDNLNVDADTLDGQHGSYYLNYNNFTNTPDLSALQEIEYANDFAALPTTGNADKVYITKDNGYMYRWNGSGYSQLTDQTAIWGQVSGTLSNQTDLQTALNGKAPTTRTITAGTGLNGGGTLAADRTLSVKYGTAAGTAAQGNDSRLTNSREWTATVVSQAEAEDGTATTARKWTAQRVRQAILGWWNGSSDKTKLDGIEVGATKNATDAYLRNRANHTGSQAMSTITGLSSALELKEDISNKKTDIEANKTADKLYPSIKGVYDWAVGKFLDLRLLNLASDLNETEQDTIKTKLNISSGELKKVGDGYGLQHQIDYPGNYGTLGNNAVSFTHSESAGDFGATGDGSHAEGYYTTAGGMNSHAEGQYTVAAGPYSHAEGNETTAYGPYSHAEGASTEAYGMASHAEGLDTTASGEYSHAEGENTTASDIASHAEGRYTIAVGIASHAEGANTTASSYAENARGVYNEEIPPISTTTFNVNDVIESVGVGTGLSARKNALTRWKNGAWKWLLQPLSNITNEVKGFHAADEDGRLNYHDGKEWNKYLIEGEGGGELKAIGDGYGLQHQIDNPTYYGTLGENAINLSYSESAGDFGATGDYSHAEGYQTIASGAVSHSEGYETTASGNSSHSEGYNTTASSFASHSEGYETIASGDNSHSEGNGTVATGRASHAEGGNTTASSYAENARGVYNEIITPISPTYFNANDVVESVGVGTSSVRKNALTRWKNGAFKWLLQPLTNITNAVIGFHAADEDGRLNYHDGTTWKKYLLEGEEGSGGGGDSHKKTFIKTFADPLAADIEIDTTEFSIGDEWIITYQDSAMPTIALDGSKKAKIIDIGVDFQSNVKSRIYLHLVEIDGTDYYFDTTITPIMLLS